MEGMLEFSQEGSCSASSFWFCRRALLGDYPLLYFIGKDGYVWAAPMKHNKTGKKKKVGTEKIAKESGFMYYIGKDGFVAKAKMKNA
jgi:hypothetical protein